MAGRRAVSAPTRIDFYFDPLCPWAYHASLWIREVRILTGLEIDWRFFSLEEINRETGKKHPWEREWSYGWSLMRVGALLRRRSMDDLDRWYGAVGAALHERGVKPHRREVAEEIAAGIGLEPTIVEEAIADPTTGDEVRRDHDGIVAAASAFGVPTLVFPSGRAVFGPKIAPAPSGDEALALWDLVCMWMNTEGIFELKRPQTSDDMANIGRIFSPYLQARDWQSVENPAPGA